jgi:uncharacterized protein (TIGR00303 family)
MWVENRCNKSGKSPDITKRYKDFENPLFILILSNSDTGTIPGISGAGSAQDYIQYTPAADAEIVSNGKLRTIEIMSNAQSGAVTPAVLTRAALNLSQTDHILINSGLKIVPGVPYYDLKAECGKDIRVPPAVRNPLAILEEAKKLAKHLDCDLAVIGETIPGGTTTALCVLRALGYQSNVSSSFAQNPLALKEKVVTEAMKKASIDAGDLQSDPMKAIELFGDPMMPCAVGLAEGFSYSGREVVLAGGTQMGAVVAALRALGCSTEVVLATTKYIFDDVSAHFSELINALGIDTFCAYPDFSSSQFAALRKYELGEVKEGVGAGGAMALACSRGFDRNDYRQAVETVIKQL